jgi:hypothetical protein
VYKRFVFKIVTLHLRQCVDQRRVGLKVMRTLAVASSDPGSSPVYKISRTFTHRIVFDEFQVDFWIDLLVTKHLAVLPAVLTWQN